jgi:hypothetical protein
MDDGCFKATHTADDTTSGIVVTADVAFSFSDLPGFKEECLHCVKHDYTHGSVLFNTFIWCQIFNEYSSRVLFNELNMFHNIMQNTMFFAVSIFTIGCQVLLIEFGGDFMKTTPLSLDLWVVTIIIGFFTLPVGFLMRLCFPVDEDPESYFDVALNEDQSGPGGVVDAKTALSIKPTPGSAGLNPAASPTKVAPAP